MVIPPQSPRSRDVGEAQCLRRNALKHRATAIRPDSCRAKLDLEVKTHVAAARLGV